MKQIAMVGMVVLGAVFSGTVVARSTTPGAPIPSTSLKFEYQSADAQFHYDCEHVSVNGADSGDWRVTCAPGTPNQREFGVHLYLQRLVQSKEPQMQINIIYSVADRRSPALSLYTSHVNSFLFKRASDVQTLQLGQSVDNDYAYLYVTIGTPSLGKASNP